MCAAVCVGSALWTTGCVDISVCKQQCTCSILCGQQSVLVRVSVVQQLFLTFVRSCASQMPLCAVTTAVEAL